MNVRIYCPTKNSMQSGKANIKNWLLEYEPADIRHVDTMMGWSSADGTEQQIKLKFSTMEEAVSYAKRNNLDYKVIEPQKPKLNIRSYSDNFTS